MAEEIEGLTKITVNLTPRAMRALNQAAALTADTRTDTINRALHLYLFAIGTRKIGERLFVGRSRWRLKELTADWFNRGDRRSTGDDDD